MARRTDGPQPQDDQKRRAPEMATRATGIAHPFLDVTPAFYLTFHPSRWTIIAGQLVPGLQKFPLAAGVNNVEISKDGRVHFAAARAKLETEGRTVIPWEWAPDGVSYLECVDTRPGGGRDVLETWISVFETADPGRSETSPDEDAYAGWLTGLVKAGKLPACSLAVARQMLDRASERLGTAQAEAAKLGGHGRAGIRAKALEIEVAVLDKYVRGVKAEVVKAKARRTPQVEADAGGGAA